jgi:hypothetical protein
MRDVPFQRFFRDIQGLSQHSVMALNSNLEVHGRLEVGLRARHAVHLTHSRVREGPGGTTPARAFVDAAPQETGRRSVSEGCSPNIA